MLIFERLSISIFSIFSKWNIFNYINLDQMDTLIYADSYEDS